MSAAAHVCHVISGYFRDDARVFLRQSKSLHANGFKVSILTNDGKGPETLQGIPIYDADRPWPRWKTLLFAKRQLLRKAIEIDADIYQLHSPELLPLGLALKRMGKAVVYDAHEDMPRHLLEKEWLPHFTRKIMSVAFERYLLFALARFNEVVSPHSHVVEDFQKILGKGILIANFPLIGYDWETSREHYRQRSGIVCYSGTVYAYSNQDEMLQAIRTFDIEYRIAGYIDQGFHDRLMSHPNANKVRFLGRLSRPDLHQFYQEARVGIVIYDYKLNLGGRLGSFGTNKIFEYMEAGLPFICTDYTLWKGIVDRYDCGVSVPPNDPDATAEALEFLLGDVDRAYRMGQNGRRAVLEEFNWGTEEAKYLALFHRLCGDPADGGQI